MPHKEFSVIKGALLEAKELGLYGKVEKRLKNMARQSAPYTHPLMNRRFQGFLLRVEDGVVINICRLEPQSGAVSIEVPEAEDGLVTEVCPDCNADGDFCMTCNSTGEVVLNQSEARRR